MFRVVLPVLIALTAAVPAAAYDDAAASQPASEKPVKEKKVCKSEVGTGSIMPKRTCRTKAEWAAITEQSKAQLDRTLRDSRATANVGGNR